MFKIGDTVRRFRGTNGGKSIIGHIGVVEKVWYDGDSDWLGFTDGESGWATSYLLYDTPSPVRTETVTRSVIVPGVYGRVGVGAGPVLHDAVDSLRVWTADELDAAALVLTQLAAAVRDV